MKKIVSSTTFAPRYDFCHFFSFTFQFPNDLHTLPTSTKTDRCPKCNSFLLQSELICPICKPENYYHRKSSTFFNTFRINIKSENPDQRYFFIIFDLDLRTDELINFSRILFELEKSKPTKDFFFFGFLGNEISFFSSVDDQIQFEFLPSIKDFKSYIKPLESYEKTLIRAIKIAKTYAQPSSDRKQSIKSFFSLFQEDPNFPYISDIIYVYSESFPTQIRYYQKPRFHLIQISERISKLNADLACRFRASFFSTPKVNESLKKHIEKIMLNETILSPHFTIISSSGICFKEFGGAIQTSSQESENITKVETFSCLPQEVPVFSCSKTDKKIYNQSKVFSYQIILHYFSDCIFIFNDVYRKAKSIDEWIQSFNRDFFLYTTMQSYANDLLKSNIHLNPPWRIIYKNIKIPKELQLYYSYSNIFRKFLSELFCTSCNLLNENQKVYILFYFCYGSFFKSVKFINFIFGDGQFELDENSKIALMDPFLITYQNTQEDEDNYFWEILYPILDKRSKQSFYDLKNFIITFQKDLQTLSEC